MNTLRVIGAIYILSAFWCLFQLEETSASLGFGFLQAAAKLEYLSVYVGLQLGLGVAMLLVARQPMLLPGGVYFSFIFSSILAVVRLIGVLTLPHNGLMLTLFALELLIALALWRVWCKEKLAI